MDEESKETRPRNRDFLKRECVVVVNFSYVETQKKAINFQVAVFALSVACHCTN